MATPSPRPLTPRPPRVSHPGRRWPRAEAEQHVLVSVVSETGTIHRGQVLDISAAGLCCHLHSAGGLLGAGEEVLLRLSFFGRGGACRAVARVVWARADSTSRPAAHYGLAWIEGADLRMIRHLLRGQEA